MRLPPELALVVATDRRHAGRIDRRIDGAAELARCGDGRIALPVGRADDLQHVWRDARLCQQRAETRRRRAVGQVEGVDHALLDFRQRLVDDLLRLGGRREGVDG
jgi:hypothetical protein